jgi:acetyl-CoA carboxylase biotin carboxyl carrier protein
LVSDFKVKEKLEDNIIQELKLTHSLENASVQYELTFKNLVEILSLIDNYNYTSLDIEVGDFKLKIEKEKQSQEKEISSINREVQKVETPEVSHKATSIGDQPELKQEVNPTILNNDYVEVKAPIMGVFYTAPSPDAEPFVHIGSEVKAGDQIGIVEVMKVFNSIKAPCDGVVKEILIENEDLVETNQVIVLLESK